MGEVLYKPAKDVYVWCEKVFKAASGNNADTPEIAYNIREMNARYLGGRNLSGDNADRRERTIRNLLW